MKKNEAIISELIIDTNLTTAQILVILGKGGKIKHKKMGHKVWLSGDRLTSDTITWVESLPQFIFNSDVKWISCD